MSEQLTIDSDGWLNPSRRCPSPNQDERPADSNIDLLVIHNISLPPGQFGGPWIEALFCNQLDPNADPYFKDIAGLEVSAHLLIRRDGELVQFVSFDRRAWHAGQSCFQGKEKCNDYSIGIELEGSDDQPFSNEQYQALARVSALLLSHYPGLQTDRITGHSDIAPGRKTDPGPYFSWARLQQELHDQLA